MGRPMKVSLFQPTGFDVAVIGIGDKGQRSVFDPQLLHNVILVEETTRSCCRVVV